MNDIVIYKVEEEVEITNADVLDFFKEGNKAAPPIIVGHKHIIRGIYVDKLGFQHLDLGLPSMYNYIRSRETEEEIPHGDSIHWVHPSRVKLVVKEVEDALITEALEGSLHDIEEPIDKHI